jgi:hypothetical protein
MSTLPFAEGAFAILPEEWQAHCLDWSYLQGCVEACTRRGASVPLPELLPDRLPTNRPRLPAALQRDLRHRKFAELAVAELDLACAFLANERRKCTTDLAAVETLATSYIQSARRASLSGDSMCEPDPYVRSRLKKSLINLYHEHARHVAFRMLNHGIICKLARLQAELVAENLTKGVSSPPAASPPPPSPVSATPVAEEPLGTEAVERFLVTFALSHELFGGIPHPTPANYASVGETLLDNGGATFDLLGLGSVGVTPTKSLIPPSVASFGASSRGSAGARDISHEKVVATSSAETFSPLREEEISALYAVLFCHGDLEVARAALSYYSPECGASVLPANSNSWSVTGSSPVKTWGGTFKNMLSLILRPGTKQRRSAPVGRSSRGVAGSLSSEVGSFPRAVFVQLLSLLGDAFCSMWH